MLIQRCFVQKKLKIRGVNFFSSSFQTFRLSNYVDNFVEKIQAWGIRSSESFNPYPSLLVSTILSTRNISSIPPFCLEQETVTQKFEMKYTIRYQRNSETRITFQVANFLFFFPICTLSFSWNPATQGLLITLYRLFF